MKNKILSLFTFCWLAFTACDDFYVKDVSTDLTENEVFSSYENACHAARSVYTDLPDGFAQVWGDPGSAMLASATDEAEFTIQTHDVQKFNTGSWLPTDLPDNPWNKYYMAIRKANNFLKNADRVNYDGVRLDPAKPGVYETQLADINQWKQEVTLLRSYYLFELVKRFGGVAIVDETLDLDMDYSTIKRNTLQECVDEIISCCDAAAKVLPAKQTDTNLGRLTSGAALALKSQVLLFAASDLWNTPSWAGSYANPAFVSLSSGDRSARWKAAADAAKAVIDIPAASGGYSLDTYANLFGANTFRSTEVIFCKRAGASNTFERTNLPISYDYVTGGNCPSQNLVDAFQVTDGTDFDWNDPAQAANPYAGRDPRLNTFVVLNNTSFKSRIVECWTGGRDGAGVRNATPTGYYLKKYVQPNLDLTTNTMGVHSWVIIRLAEVYLNYIEALNEYSPGHADIKTYYDLLRNRPGVAMPGLPGGLDQDQVRELIRKERFVELCFEGQRWFDLRRWMKGDILGGTLRGVQITKTDASFTYAPYDMEKRIFENKMYFYPIPQSELNKLSQWVQNPLW